MPVAAVRYASPASVPKDLARYAAVSFVGRPPPDVAALPAVLYMPGDSIPADQRRVGVVEYFPNQTVPADMRRVCLTQPAAPEISLTVVSDTFTRADSALTLGNAETGQAWGTASTWGVASGKGYLVNATGGGSDPHAWVDSGVANGAIACDVTVSTTVENGLEGLLFNRLDGSNYFVVRISNNSDTISILRNLAGVRSTIASVALVLADAQTVAVRVVRAGSSILVYADGLLMISTTDSSHATATAHGVYASKVASARFDNFRVTR